MPTPHVRPVVLSGTEKFRLLQNALLAESRVLNLKWGKWVKNTHLQKETKGVSHYNVWLVHESHFMCQISMYHLDVHTLAMCTAPVLR
jgi:hypothetical protein